MKCLLYYNDNNTCELVLFILFLLTELLPFSSSDGNGLIHFMIEAIKKLVYKVENSNSFKRKDNFNENQEN